MIKTNCTQLAAQETKLSPQEQAEINKLSEQDKETYFKLRYDGEIHQLAYQALFAAWA